MIWEAHFFLTRFSGFLRLFIIVDYKCFSRVLYYFTAFTLGYFQSVLDRNWPIPNSNIAILIFDRYTLHTKRASENFVKLMMLGPHIQKHANGGTAINLRRGRLKLDGLAKSLSPPVFLTFRLKLFNIFDSAAFLLTSYEILLVFHYFSICLVLTILFSLSLATHHIPSRTYYVTTIAETLIKQTYKAIM